MQQTSTNKRKKSDNPSTRELRPRKTATIERVNEGASTSEKAVNEDVDETDDGKLF